MTSLKKPLLTTKEDMENLLEQIWPGGMTLIENSSSFGAEFILHSFIHFSKSRGIPLIVEDIFDTLPIYLAHLELMGAPIDESDVKVIKVGGSHNVGEVLGRIRFENDPYVYQQKLKDELKKININGTYIHLVLGLERFLALQEGLYHTYTLLSLIRQKLGNESSMNVYLVETPVLSELSFNPLPILEDIATSVAKLMDEGELIKIDLKKSVFTLLRHKDYFLVSPRDVLRWLE
jgi:hypothetical protein